jgi:hypothetical protein
MMRVACILLAAMAMMQGCTQSESEAGRQDMVSDAPVVMTSVLGGGFGAGDEMAVFMHTQGTIERRRYIAAADGSLVPAAGEEPLFYPPSGSVALSASYPYAEDGAFSVADQSSPARIDVMYALAPDVSRSKTPVALRFEHLMGRITLEIGAGEGLTQEEIDALGEGDVMFAGMPVEAVLTADGTLRSGDEDPARYALYRAEGAVFSAIVIPQTAGRFAHRAIIITLGGREYRWNIPASEVFAAGDNNLYPLTVGKAGLVVGTSEIADWDLRDNGSGTARMEPNATVTFSDGSSADAYCIKAGAGLYKIVFAGEGEKVVRSVQLNDFPGREYLVGRADNSTITLKIAADGALQFRDKDAGGNIPIGTYAELAMISSALGGSYLQEASLDMLGAGYAPQNHKPTGSESIPFTGRYDGGGHTIANLYVDADNNAGLFGYIGAGAELSRVGIVSGSVRGANVVGGVCGYNHGGTITDCHNAAVVTGDMDVGGVCGMNNSRGSIIACRNTGTVNGMNDFSIYIGGVCGENMDGGSVTASYNTGAVSGQYYIGGVCGMNSYGSLNAGFNSGIVSGEYGFAGGVCGGNFAGDIVGCYYVYSGATPAVGNSIEGSMVETFAFADGSWPDGKGGWAAVYWKSLGAWRGGAPAYPKLRWE